MSIFRIFYYEDDRNVAVKVKYGLENAWKCLKDGVIGYPESFQSFSDMKVNYCSENDQAFKDADGGKFQLAILDLWDADNHNVGSLLAEGLKGNRQNIGLIAISRSAQMDPDESEAFKALAADRPEGKYGTHGIDYIHKKKLLGGGISAKELAIRILRVCADAGVISRPKIEFDLRFLPEDPTDPLYYHMLSIKDNIGEKHLKEMISDWLYINGKDASRLELQCLLPGKSGAEVLRLATNEYKLLMKLDQNRDRLVREIDRYPEIGGHFDHLFVRYPKSKEIVSTGDNRWHAFFAAFLGNARTLLEFLTATSKRDDLENVISNIRDMGDVYGSTREESNETALQAAQPASHRAAKISKAILELKKLAEKHCNGRVTVDTGIQFPAFSESVLENFLQSESPLRALVEKHHPRKAYLCRCHGDFHSKNILISKTANSFRLIDPAEVGKRFWPSDMARLIVDLIVSGWDHGDTAVYEWDSFSDWRKLTAGVICWVPVAESVGFPKNAPSLGIATALDWIMENIFQIYGDLAPLNKRDRPGWEFQVALAVEFMMASYREWLPAPKRVLGLVAAHDALLAAENSFRKSYAVS